MDSCPQVDLTYFDPGCPVREHFEQPVVVCSGAAVEESAGAVGAAVVLATAEVNVYPIQPGWPQFSNKDKICCILISFPRRPCKRNIWNGIWLNKHLRNKICIETPAEPDNAVEAGVAAAAVVTGFAAHHQIETY